MLIRTDEKADIATPTGMMRVHLFRPQGEGRFPAILLFSEIYQVTAPIERLAAMIAGRVRWWRCRKSTMNMKLQAAFWLMTSRGTDRGNELKYTKPVAQFDSDNVALIAWLRNHEGCSGRFGAFGVCLGGHLAYRAALLPEVEATACFYATDLHSASLGAGQSDDSLARARDVRGELMMVWGRSDPHVPYEGRKRIRDAFEVAEIRLEWHEVDGQHAFLRDGAPRFDAALFLQAMSWTNALYQRAFIAQK